MSDTAQGSITDAFPRLVQAAEILGVTSNSLSLRMPRLEGQLGRVGNDVLFPPTVVLELARLYRSRDTSEVAAELVNLARAQAPEWTSEIEGQVDVWLDNEIVEEAPFDKARFLAEARRWLPAELYTRTEAALNGDHPPVDGGSITNLTE